MRENYLYLLGCLLVLIIIAPQVAFSQSTISLNNTEELTDIGNQTYYLEDATLDVSIHEILNDIPKTNFQSYSQETLNFSSTASAYWIKFNIKKEVPGNFYINVGSAYIDSILLYEVAENGIIISTRETGDDLPFSSREVAVANYLFALDFDEGVTRSFYLRVKSDQPLFFPLKVGTLSNFTAYEHDLDFLQGIYFGIMLLIFMYNLFLYFSTRERIYLYYIAYVFSITWFMASIFGYYFEYFWPNAPFLNKMVVVSSGLTMITATLFTQNFLDTKASNSRMHNGSKVFLVIGFLVCVLVLLGYKVEGLKVAQGGLLIMSIYFLILGIRFKLKGYRPATYYLLAWGALIIGITFAILESLNIIPVMNYLNAMQIGSALEVVLLSFALGARINAYKKQKEVAQKAALLSAKENEKLIQNQNIELEKKVTERTSIIAIRNKELMDLNKEKDMLVDMVSHDLRTPLHQIKGIMWILDVPSMNLTEEQENYLNEINNSVDRLTELISRILNSDALQTDQIIVKNETFNVVDLVTYVVKCFHITATNKNMEILVEAEKGNHFIEADRNYMIQVVENLLSNAIKFSEKGSKVLLQIKSAGGKTYVVVQDYGPGISENDQKKLFGRFQRLSAQPTAGESSIGLGLAIVKKYIEAMNGNVHCESELGEGTKFILSFASQTELPKVM